MQAALGPFVLGDRAGQGGQGVVHRAEHPEGLVVAIKLPTHAAATDRGYVAAFHEEARAFAALDHPAIARIFDYGTVPPEVERLTEGALRAGLPWLAMEWASGGTLAAQTPPRSMTELRSVLEPLLGALAHVHAHGLVHRDVKPENVLVCTATDGAPGLRLADFGLVMSTGSRGALLGGTPAYMAPEQREGIEHAQGPWTDVYSVGVMAWELVAGRRPAPRQRVERAALEPRFEVPDAVVRWLETTLSLLPGERYLDATDALHALRAACVGTARTSTSRAVHPMRDAPERTRVSTSAHGRAQAWSEPHHPTEGATTITEPSPATSATRLLGLQRAALPPIPGPGAPIPSDWREARAAESASPSNAGRGVLMLRPPPLVGREAERDRLWAALGDATRQRRTRAVVLEGVAGIGKTRLARWLAVRARELGVASVADATHHAPAERGDGLPPMLARLLRLDELASGAMREGIALAAPWLEPDERAALARMLTGGPAPERVRPRDRVVLASRVLATLARERPLVVVLDDVPLGPEALALVRELLDVENAAILVVVTARDEALAEQPAIAEELRKLTEDARVEHVALGPLAPRETGTLVRSLLGLDAPSAVAIEARAGGHPAFAVELVTAALERGRLEPGPDGFRLAGALELPSDLTSAWRQRVERALAPFGDTERRALVVAAALGERVDVEEWRTALAARSLAPSPRLVERLLAARLARGEGLDAWRFAHGTLREAIVAGASEAEVRAAHAACVRALEDRPSERARLGRHLLRAGRAAEALPPLLAAVDGLDAAGDYPAAAALLADAEEALLSLPSGSPLRGEVLVRRMKATRHVGRLAEARALGRALHDDASRDGWSAAAHAELHVELADLERLSGDAARAIALLDEAEHLAGSDRVLGVGVRRRRAQALIDAGRLEEARSELVQVHDDPAAAVSERVMARRLAGVVLRLRGEPEAAARVLQDALPDAEGLRWQTAELLNALGDALRAAGELERAERSYAEGLARFRALASGDAPVVELNHGLLMLARGAWAGAGAIAQRTAAVFARNQRRPLLAAALALGLAPRLAHGERDAFDREIAEVESLLASTGFVEKDLAFIFERAEALALERGEHARAARLADLLAAQRARLR